VLRAALAAQHRPLSRWVRRVGAARKSCNDKPRRNVPVRAMLSRAMGKGKSSHTESAVVIPLNYAQVRCAGPPAGLASWLGVWVC
jgi:hypothetical protein